MKMKRTISIFILFLVFIAGSFHSALAYTESECNSSGGTCQSAACGNSSSTIGSCWESGNVNFNRTNCCGNASQAQQQSPTIGATTGGGSFGNPLGNTNTLQAVLTNITSYLRGIAGTIAVIFIIIGGIMYMVSGGSKETAERAKKTLIFAIAGLAIVLAAPLFYTEIKAVLSGNSPGSALQSLLVNVLKLLLSIVGFLAIISMVVGAIWMLTAVGDEERYELGKKTAGYSILGLTIALAALVIANQVKTLLGG